MKHNSRAAFTLVELLVVVLIIFALMGLLLPTIQSAREAARRSMCQNQLTQLILAVHHYESAHLVYPPGTIDAKGPIVNAQLGYHHNWLIQILPFFEQGNTWKAINKQVGVYHAKNAPMLPMMPSILDCPSSPAPQGNPCYAGVHHDQEKPIDAQDSGVLFLNSRVRLDDLADGSAHTIFLGEKLPDGWDLHWMSGTRATLRNAGSGINTLTFNNGLPRITGDRAALTSDYVYSFSEAEQAIEQQPAEFPTFALAAPLAAGGPGNPSWVGGFSSAHPPGALFAFGDGNVRLLLNATALSTLQQLAHRSDGKLLPRY
jgi:type II secretory pathway pseudopilin PulG